MHPPIRRREILLAGGSLLASGCLGESTPETPPTVDTDPTETTHEPTTMTSRSDTTTSDGLTDTFDLEAWTWGPHMPPLEVLAERYDRPVTPHDVRDVEGKFEAAIEGNGSFPSVSMLKPDYYRKRALSGDLLEIPASVADPHEDILPFAKAQFSVRGDYYGVFPSLGPLLYVGNRSLFEEAGLPTTADDIEAEMVTWQDWLEMAALLEEETGATMSIDAWHLHVLLQQFGGRWYDSEGSFAYDQPSNVEAFQLKQSLQEYTGPGWLWSDSGERAFRNGDVATVIAPIWWISNRFPETFPEMDLVVVRLPKAKNGTGAHGGNLGGSPGCVPEALPKAHREEALKFGQYWHVSDDAIDVKLEHEMVPARRVPNDHPALDRSFEAYGGQTVMDRAVAAVESLPPCFMPPVPELVELHSQTREKIFNGGGDIEATLATYHEKMLEVLPEADRTVEVSQS